MLWCEEPNLVSLKGSVILSGVLWGVFQVGKTLHRLPANKLVCVLVLLVALRPLGESSH